MRIDIRIYKRFDTDLVALCDAGYPLSKMFHDALTAFAYGQPLHYLVDAPVRFNPDGKTSVHYAFSIPDSDKTTCGLLKSIQKGYRNSFCKAVLRNTMVNQNVGCFLKKGPYMDMAKTQIAAIDTSAYQNLIPLSAIKSGHGQLRFQIPAGPVVKPVVPEKEEIRKPQNSVPQETEQEKPPVPAPEPDQEDDSQAPGLANNDALMKIFDAL